MIIIFRNNPISYLLSCVTFKANIHITIHQVHVKSCPNRGSESHSECHFMEFKFSSDTQRKVSENTEKWSKQTRGQGHNAHNVHQQFLLCSVQCLSSRLRLGLRLVYNVKGPYLVALYVLLQACSSVCHRHPPHQGFMGGHWPGVHICRGLRWDWVGWGWRKG